MKKRSINLHTIYFIGALVLSSVFCFGQLPTITGFSPSSGPVGTIVTITGTNFNNPIPTGNTVFFGATKATVNTATTNQLTVVVPSGATYQPISILVSGQLAYSNGPFLVTFNGTLGISASSFDTKVDSPVGTNPSSIGTGDVDFFCVSRSRNVILKEYPIAIGTAIGCNRPKFSTLSICCNDC